MPELPEVETTRRGLMRCVLNQMITKVVIRQYQLRWPIAQTLATMLVNQHFNSITRRGKYLLFATETGTLLIHLGMSGSLRLVNSDESVRKHDHVDIHLGNQYCLRYHDPRRFGSILWTTGNPQQHALLKHLGLEPLDKVFTGKYLYQRSRNKSQAIKNFIMDNHIVVGVGNIYANEALFLSGIRPQTASKKISLAHYTKLIIAIKQVLSNAIEQGGTTLRDFVNGHGQAGYFQQQLYVYGRKKQACKICSTPIKQLRLGQRSSFYCPNCQH